MKNVETETTIARLCRVIAKLEEREKALLVVFGDGDFSIDEINDLKDTVLDLAGAPEDNTADGDFKKPDLFCRDWLHDELAKIIKAGDFQGVHLRMKALVKEALDGGVVVEAKTLEIRN